MELTCIADLHGHLPPLPGGDLLILAGDYTGADRIPQWCDFFAWLKVQPYRKKVLIGGNHDGWLSKAFPKTQQQADELAEVQSWLRECGEKIEEADFDYLCDSGIEFEGFKIWGSPYTPTFCNWYFMEDRGEPIKAHWDLIPNDTDILITHGPPLGILDKVQYSSRALREGNAGCADLRTAVERVQPLLHVFGHIHESYGEILLKCTPRDVKCVNCAIMNAWYYPVNKPIQVELKHGKST